jgi:Tol biopolymer transport system component
LFSGVAWSPDGTRLALSRADGSGGLFVIAAGGGAKTRLAAPQGGGPNLLGGWSPDGRQLAYEQTWVHFSYATVINVDGSGYRILPINGDSPKWAPR